MRLDASRFTLGRCFSGLEFNQIQAAVDDVWVMFYGAVEELWAMMKPGIRDAKRELVWNYLTAWKLCNDYPEAVIGIISNPVMPLSSKKIKNISLNFRDITRQGGGLEVLQNNPFGTYALTMILSAPENFCVTGGS